MAKLQLLQDGLVIDEFPLTMRTTIGRRARCDIFLDHPGVSGIHAVLERIGENYFLQDQDSTNGTKLNGRKISQVKIHDGDEIKIARFKLRFLARESEEIARTVILPVEDDERILPLVARAVPEARMRVLDGPHAGKELQLVRENTTFGKSGLQVLMVAKQTDGYFVSQIEGPGAIDINGNQIGDWPHRLSPGDRLKVLGTTMLFEYRS